MEQRQKTAKILKFAKRRFDGGSEVDLIRAIEAAQVNNMMGNPVANQSYAAPMNVVPIEQAPTVQKAKRNRIDKLTEAAIRGPLQVSIGLVGMLTAGLAIVTFKRVNNEPMVQQSQAVFTDCRKTLQKGLWDSFTTPVRVGKLLLNVKK